jgi:hypothetical protein
MATKAVCTTVEATSAQSSGDRSDQFIAAGLAVGTAKLPAANQPEGRLAAGKAEDGNAA